MTTQLKAPATCTCGFTTSDIYLLQNHSCDVQAQGGRCEDYPCCGHEDGDCNGLLYGSDEAIKEEAMRHIGCDHEAGVYDCEGLDDYDEDEETDNEIAWHGSAEPLDDDRSGFMGEYDTL